MYYAHSGNDKDELQSYEDHVNGVITLSSEYYEKALAYYSDPHVASRKMATIKAAAEYHDLGKLDDLNQVILSGEQTAPHLPINHKDAGTAFCLANGAAAAAYLIYCHHGGLQSLPKEANKGNDALRDIRVSEVIGDIVRSHVDTNLNTYLERHGNATIEAMSDPHVGLDWRIALSALVDADHTDTAFHYGFEKTEPEQCRWAERLQSLDEFVGSLDDGSALSARRQSVYSSCRHADPAPVSFCPVTVGGGKTLSTLAYAINCAIANRLRRIIIVAPYVNIINQTVSVLRNAVVLPGEDPTRVVGAHHHHVEFESDQLKYLTTLWDTPIVVTTAVQFFETLASNKCGRLRKLHQLPGSAVIIDESHSCMPMHLWRLAWRWLQDLADRWRCFFTLASGSMVKFWEFNGFVESEDITKHVPAQIISDDVHSNLVTAEAERLNYHENININDEGSLIQFITSKPGPRLVVLNTIVSAAKLANRLDSEGHHVLHLSTALTPAHRNATINDVKQHLSNGDTDWTLVATSCVECGVDLSFRTGFREKSSVNGRIQTGGRVNRNFDVVGDLYTVALYLTQDGYKHNPGFMKSREVYDEMLEKGGFDLPPDELATESVKIEFLFKPHSTTSTECVNPNSYAVLENSCDFPSVRDAFRIIPDDTALVVVDDLLADAIANGHYITNHDLVNSTVRVRVHSKAFDYTEPLGDGCYRWVGAYNEFLGYADALVG